MIDQSRYGSTIFNQSQEGSKSLHGGMVISLSQEEINAFHQSQAVGRPVYVSNNRLQDSSYTAVPIMNINNNELTTKQMMQMTDNGGSKSNQVTIVERIRCNDQIATSKEIGNENTKVDNEAGLENGRGCDDVICIEEPGNSPKKKIDINKLVHLAG